MNWNAIIVNLEKNSFSVYTSTIKKTCNTCIFLCLKNQKIKHDKRKRNKIISKFSFLEGFFSTFGTCRETFYGVSIFFYWIYYFQLRYSLYCIYFFLFLICIPTFDIYWQFLKYMISLLSIIINSIRLEKIRLQEQIYWLISGNVKPRS